MFFKVKKNNFSLAVLVLSLCLAFLNGCANKQETVLVPDTLTAGIDAQSTHQEKVLMQKEIIKRQEQEIQKQDRELEDIERQKLYNDSLRRFESN